MVMVKKNDLQKCPETVDKEDTHTLKKMMPCVFVESTPKTCQSLPWNPLPFSPSPNRSVSNNLLITEQQHQPAHQPARSQRP